MENLLLMEEIPNNHLGIMSNRQIMGYFHIFSISTGECRISEPSTVLGGCFKYDLFADWSPQMMVCSQNLEKHELISGLGMTRTGALQKGTWGISPTVIFNIFSCIYMYIYKYKYIIPRTEVTDILEELTHKEVS